MFHRFGIEYAAPKGLSSSWSGMPDTGPFGLHSQPVGSNGINGIMIPEGHRLLRVYGSMVIKNDEIELLARLVCGTGDDFVEVWNSHAITAGPVQEGRISVWTPAFPGDDRHLYGLGGWNALWIEHQLINAGNPLANGPGRGWEAQLTAITIDV